MPKKSTKKSVLDELLEEHGSPYDFEPSSQKRSVNMNSRWFMFGVVAVIVLVAAVLTPLFPIFGYAWTSVGDQYIGIETVKGNVTRVREPGVQTNMTAWADLNVVNVSQIPWCAVDPEVLTKDSQRLGFVVCGTVQRPGQGDFVPETTQQYYTYNKGENWVAFKTYYLNDQLLAGSYHIETSGTEQVYIIDSAGKIQELAQQSMKSCVGDRNFDEAVVGSNRDGLRACIDENISILAANYGGMKVQNVTVPNVILGSAVQAKLDEITSSKFETEVFKQNAAKEVARGEENLAREQAAIQVAQGIEQEKARQQAETQRLQAEAERAKTQLIEAQKANELLTANKDLEINKVELEAALLRARSTNAWEVVLADLMNTNPEYAYYSWLKLAAAAWDETDKVIVPVGTDPLTVINPWGTSPALTVPVTP